MVTEERHINVNIVSNFYANIVMGHHDKTTLIPKHKPEISLLHCLINDKFVIFIPTNTPEVYNIQTQYKNECTNLNAVSSLTWELFSLVSTLDFLELTITILNNGFLNLQTYQNPWNLCIYLPAKSAHSPETLCRLIH